MTEREEIGVRRRTTTENMDMCSECCDQCAQTFEDCYCDPSINFTEVLKMFTGLSYRNINFGPLYISLIKYGVKLSSSLNLSGINTFPGIVSKEIGSRKGRKNLIKTPNSDNFLGHAYGENDDTEVTKPVRRAFPNCLNAKHVITGDDGEDSNIDIKIFKNGSISMTGARTYKAMIRSVVKVVKLIVNEHNEIGNIIDNPLDFYIDDININMINSNFDTGVPININRINEIFNTHFNVFSKNIDSFGLEDRILISSYDRESRYKATKMRYIPKKILQSVKKTIESSNICNIELQKTVTVSIFSTGRIVIMGGTNIQDYLDAYTFVFNVLKERYDYLVTNDYVARNRKKSRKIKNTDGWYTYDINDT